jgi:raffinose/stachyose/melibiose transport system substrate-binding protein
MRRRHTIRTVGAAAAAAITATLLAACGSSGPSASTTTSTGAITMWILNDQTVLESAVTAWNKANPSEKIDLSLYSNDAYKQKLSVAFGAHQAPDIFFNWGGGALDSYVQAGDVASISSADVSTSKFTSSVMTAATFNGDVYGIPCNGTGPVVLFYNKKVMAAAGLSAPTTLAQLQEDVTKLKGKGVTPIALGASDDWPTLMYIEYLADRIGGSQVFDGIKGGNTSDWTSPTLTTANQDLQTLYKDGAFGADAGSMTYDSGTPTAMLYTGKAAMELMGTWEYANIQTADPSMITSGNLGWTAFPTVAGGTGNTDDIAGNLSNYLSVNSDAKDKTAIDKFLSDYVMDSSQVSQYLASGAVPPVNGLGSQIAAITNSQKPWLQYIYNLVQNAPSFQLSWDQALPDAYTTPLYTNVDKSLLGEITPASFGENMSKVG